MQMLAPKDFLSHRYFFVHANDNPIRSSRIEKVFEIHRLDDLKGLPYFPSIPLRKVFAKIK